MGALTFSCLALAYYTNFIDQLFIPMEPLARQFLIEDLPYYAGYYGGAWLFVAFIPKRTNKHENVNHHDTQESI